MDKTGIAPLCCDRGCDLITNLVEVSSSTTDPEVRDNVASKDMDVKGGKGDPGAPR